MTYYYPTKWYHLVRYMPKLPLRINGDMRKRKRRLREKLAKQDAIRYSSWMDVLNEEMRRRVIDKIEHEIFADKQGGNETWT